MKNGSLFLTFFTAGWTVSRSSQPVSSSSQVEDGSLLVNV